LLEQGRGLQTSHADMASLATAGAALAIYKEQLFAATQQSALTAQQASLGQIDLRIARLLQQQAAPPSEPSNADAPMMDRLAVRLAEPYRQRLRFEAGRQELDYLQHLRSYLVAAAGRSAALRELARLEQAHRLIYAVYLQRKDEKRRLSAFSQWRMEHPRLAGRLSVLQAQVDSAATASNAAQAAVQSQQRAIERMDAVTAQPVFHPDRRIVDSVSEELDERTAAARRAVEANWLSRLVWPVLAVLPLASLLLLAGLAAHLAVKLLFYFVLAPLAERRKPIELDCVPKDDAGEPRGGASAVSQQVVLHPGQELLLLPDYLQSASIAAAKDTQWLLDWRRPWTSLVSGMVMLTRVRTRAAADYIVVSSNADAFSEVALIDVPAGAAMVFQPRGLVGVVHSTAAPLQIAARWQLLSAHAWLTMQLRYLIFRGPVTLIVKGTRGVRIEPAGRGRLISQAATLGFSSHLAYATTRSATFVSYYMNKTALLDDRFEGDGLYVYAETARTSPRGLVGRSLEGAVDAVLKVFGI
jgi:hypothetical protein